MLMFDSSYQSRVGLVLDEIRKISSWIQTDQRVIHEVAGQHTHAQLEVLSDIKSSRADLRRLLELMSQPSRPQTSRDDREANATAVRSTRVIRIQAHVHTKAWCNPSCNCACHITKAARSPQFLRQVMGILFIECSGHCFWTRRICTLTDCSGSSTFHGSIEYFFPMRTWARALCVTLLLNSYSAIRMALTIRRIVSPGAEIFRLVNAGDIEGMKRLFKLGLASPIDSYENGTSLLGVRIDFMNSITIIDLLLQTVSSSLYKYEITATVTLLMLDSI